MPSDGVKQRKGKIATSNNGETTETPKPCGGDGEKKDGDVWGKTNPRSLVDIRTVVSLVSLSACFLLAWAVLQQNARFDEVEEKYRHLYEKASDLLALENKFSAASKKLEASEDHLKGALSSLTMLTALQQETSFLNSIVTAMQEDQHASSHRLKRVNERFLNVTETWQGGLNTVTEDLTMLRSESRSVHGRVTERVNEAEESLRALAKRLEELEDSTKRNGRALERTEEDDAKSVQSQLDWNTKQVSRLQEQFGLLSKRDVEFEEKLVEMEPQAKECETHLPAVEDAEVQLPLSQMSSLKQEVAQLKEWSSGLNERRELLHTNLAHLTQAVELIENRTTAISSDVTAKVASVRTDVRRMGGLEGDVEALLNQTNELESKVTQAEKLMVKRIGELLANSISRVSSLKTSTEKNAKSLEQIRKRIPELYAADTKITERVLALESSRAKLTRTVTFASDLRPKVSTIKRDFAMLEPQLADLTLRIGNLAEDMMKREEEISQIRESLAKFADVKKDLKKAQEDLAVEVTTDVVHPKDLSETLDHTE
ncbi:inhibitor of nuclear factor kappa-B kinase-interacting protein isoform X13, partial [Silurus meridionalis]